MAERNELIAYALDFVSYLTSKVDDGINRIVLFGSVARDDFDNESDIDLFIDTIKNEKKIEKKVNEAVENYYKTKKFKEWELKGVSNNISCITGSLDSKEWKDLKRSIINNGIVLYGKYKAETEKVAQYVLISFENIKPDKKRVSVFRKLFGFKIRNKEYPGLISQTNAIKIGKGSLLVPIEQFNEIKKFFREKKIPIKLYDLWSDIKYEK